MAPITGTFQLTPRPEDYQPCAWCGARTSFRANTPGRPDLGQIPMHSQCMVDVVYAYDEWKAGRYLPTNVERRLVGLLAPPPKV